MHLNKVRNLSRILINYGRKSFFFQTIDSLKVSKTYLIKSCFSYEWKICLKKSLDLSNGVLWMSVGQRAAKLPAVKVLGLKKNSVAQPTMYHAHAAQV